ncbi:MAG: methyltransferase domain-containing protein [Chloroflexi bacterium]|nr:methyltransferase domain-containing protein [Chloroflexota bacterium]
MTHHYPTLPELIDLDFGDFTEDLPLYEQLAQRCDGPILELGVGTGRVALTLARAGYEVWGIDSSSAMLDHARSKAAPNLTDRLHLEQADMRDFALDRKFALVFAGFGGFDHLLSPDDQARCLRRVRDHLAPGGLFVCDLRPLLHNTWELGDSAPIFHDWTRELPETGMTVMKTHSVKADAARQYQRQTNIYDCISADGQIRRIIDEVDLRFTTRYEMEGLLRDAELEVEQVYGDYDLAPYDDTSEYMITVAQRPEEPA